MSDVQYYCTVVVQKGVKKTRLDFHFHFHFHVPCSTRPVTRNKIRAWIARHAWNLHHEKNLSPTPIFISSTESEIGYATYLKHL